MSGHKICHRFILMPLRWRRSKPLLQEFQFGREWKEWREKCRHRVGRDEELQSVRKGDQPALHQHVGLAASIIRPDQISFESQLRAELPAGRLFTEERIRPRLQQEIPDALRPNHAAQAFAALEKRKLDTRLVQLIGGTQAGDAAAHDRDLHARLRTSPASAATNAGESFSDSVRHNFIPFFSANLLNPMSMSYSTSTWSQTNPIGCIITAVAPWFFSARMVSSTVGPSHGPPEIPWLWNA